jgi:hypothetical protein
MATMALSSIASRLAVPAAVISCMALAPLGAQPKCQGPDNNRMWLMAANRIALIQAIDAQLADHFFNNNCTYVFDSPWTVSSIAGWAYVSTADFQSYADFQTAIDNRTINGAVRAVMYDNENWSQTPANEQVAPALYTQMFSSLAHANGYIFISTPATDLASSQPGYESENTLQEEFIRLGIASVSAKVADIYNIQGQSQEFVAGKYVYYIGSVAAQARQANPSVMVMAGITTNSKGSNTPTPDELYEAVISTKSIVSGYWLNIPEIGPPCTACTMAVDFLRELQAQPPSIPPPFRRARP